MVLTLIQELGQAITGAVKRAYPDAVVPELAPVGRSARAEHGDLQTAVPLQWARKVGDKPLELAGKIQAYVSHPAVARAEVAAPGFVNFWLKDDWLTGNIDSSLTLRLVGAGQMVVIDYSSPNVAKPMHIGHIRSTIIGDALKRILRALGYTVIADNHLGDWGTQFGKLIVAYHRWLDPTAYEADPVAELLRIYIKYSDEEKRERGAAPLDTTTDDDDATPAQLAPPILVEARAELVKLQAGDAANVQLWKEFIQVSMREFERVYARLGVEFDVVLGESFYNDRLADTVALLEKKGIAETSEGAKVVFFTKERDGQELPPFLVQKADGGYLYGTTDVAALLYRTEKWQPVRILIVTDERQQLHFRQLFAVGRRLGVDASLEHIWFGLMRLPEGAFSTRDGNVIALEELLDEAERRAYEVAREANAELSATELREIARVVGLGAVKYNDLSRDRQTLVTFTWDKALSLQGNTAPYLQYAYARIRSIVRKAGAAAVEQSVYNNVLLPQERNLLWELFWFPAVVEEVAKTTRPNILADYLFRLAGLFSSFYAEVPVLKAESAEEKQFRLRLCAEVADALRQGLALLGIEVLERM